MKIKILKIEKVLKIISGRNERMLNYQRRAWFKKKLKTIVIPIS